MEGGGEIGEFLEWEVLPNADDTSSESVESSHVSFEGMIRADYFSLENQERYAKSEVGSVESDNPSWIDPVSVPPSYAAKEPAEFWSDSASDRSDDRKSIDFEVRKELGLGGIETSLLGLVGNGAMEAVDDNLGKFVSDEAKLSGLDAASRVGSEEIEEVQSPGEDSSKWSDSSGEAMVSVKAERESEMGLSEMDRGSDLNQESAESVEQVKAVAKLGGEGEKRVVLWWKVPLEVLKYCVFKVSPVWSLSLAAAVMGLVFLGRRLYRMKRKSQSLQLKLALDDKKVSQFMSRAVRLNEAFSVVRRVPVVRPSLPAAGVNPWPVMSLR